VQPRLAAVGFRPPVSAGQQAYARNLDGRDRACWQARRQLRDRPAGDNPPTGEVSDVAFLPKHKAVSYSSWRRYPLFRVRPQRPSRPRAYAEWVWHTTAVLESEGADARKVSHVGGPVYTETHRVVVFGCLPASRVFRWVRQSPHVRDTGVVLGRAGFLLLLGKRPPGSYS
jgi:hypothetical protein